MKRAGDGDESFETLSPGCGNADALMSSQPLWLPAQDRAYQWPMGGWLGRPHPSLNDHYSTEVFLQWSSHWLVAHVLEKYPCLQTTPSSVSHEKKHENGKGIVGKERGGLRGVREDERGS